MYVNDWTVDFGERGRKAVAAGLKGIVVEAGGCMIIDLPAVRAAAALHWSRAA